MSICVYIQILNVNVYVLLMVNAVQIKSAEDCVTVDTKEECKPITISVTSGSGASVIATGPAVNPIYQQVSSILLPYFFDYHQFVAKTVRSRRYKCAGPFGQQTLEREARFQKDLTSASM